MLDTPGLRKFLGDTDPEVNELLGELRHAREASSELRGQVNGIRDRRPVKLIKVGDSSTQNNCKKRAVDFFTTPLMIRNRDKGNECQSVN